MTQGLESHEAQAAGVDATPAAVLSESVSDDQLMARYVAGDMSAFETLYARHKGALYRFFLRQLPQAQAQDSYQETWSKLIASAGKYQAKGLFQAYLFKLAHNVLTDQHRKNMRHQSVEVDPDTLLDPTPGLTEQISRDEIRQSLHNEIAKLPVNQRTVWLIKQETPLSLADIATLTNTTLEGVKSRLRYANEKLKAGMQRYV